MVFLCGDSSPNGRMITAIFTWIVLNNSSEIRSNQQFGFQTKKFEKFPFLSMAVVSNLPVKTNRWIKVQECWRILGYFFWLGKIRVQTVTLVAVWSPIKQSTVSIKLLSCLKIKRIEKITIQLQVHRRSEYEKTAQQSTIPAGYGNHFHTQFPARSTQFDICLWNSLFIQSSKYDLVIFKKNHVCTFPSRDAPSGNSALWKPVHLSMICHNYP